MKRLGELLVQSVISMQQLMSAEQLTQGGNLFWPLRWWNVGVGRIAVTGIYL